MDDLHRRFLQRKKLLNHLEHAERLKNLEHVHVVLLLSSASGG